MTCRPGNPSGILMLEPAVTAAKLFGDILSLSFLPLQTDMSGRHLMFCHQEAFFRFFRFPNSCPLTVCLGASSLPVRKTNK